MRTYEQLHPTATLPSKETAAKQWNSQHTVQELNVSFIVDSYPKISPQVGLFERQEKSNPSIWLTNI